MNRFTKLSIEYANQRSYLDDLFQVYPTIPEGIREIDQEINECEDDIDEQIRTGLRLWLNKKALGVTPVRLDKFLIKGGEDAILDGNNKFLTDFAINSLGYTANEKIDFVGKFGGRYVLGMVKFFFGQDDLEKHPQIPNGIDENEKIEKVLILDGCLHSSKYDEVYKRASSLYKDWNVMSVLLLRSFLYQL